MEPVNIKEIMCRVKKHGIVVPAFNIPHLPMMEPIIDALNDMNTIGMIAVARLEWVKFSSKSQKAIADEYVRRKKGDMTFLHQDHIPVIDEDGCSVDYLQDILEALDLGFESVMIDGSRLNLQENIEAVSKVCTLADPYGVPVEAELGSVIGHESSPSMDYEELFDTGKGFTDVQEAIHFVTATEIDWLSVAVGSIHGAISKTTKNKKKITARLNLEHLEKLNIALDIPLVLHGGSGIADYYLLESFKRGITKLNIGTDTRQPYEAAVTESVVKAQDTVYNTTCEIIKKLGIVNSADRLI